MKRVAIFTVISAVSTLVVAGEGSAAPRATTLVVDDDRAQCAQAGYTSIQGALDDAQAGDLIRVCPGRYVERVVVTMPLTIKGQPDELEAIDCFAAAALDPDPTRHAIVEPPPEVSQAGLFNLAADDIELAGFVLQGDSGVDPTGFARAVTGSDEHSGYRIHHNLIQSNTIAAVFQSNGAHLSSFDHNCVRDNGWGLANDFGPLVNAEIHHNATFRTANFAYEQTAALDDAGVASTGMDTVTFHHNESRQDHTSFRVAASEATTIFENTLEPARFGIRLAGGTHGLQIVDNQIRGFRDVAIPSMNNLPPNTAALIHGNTITATGGVGRIAMGLGVGAIRDSEISANVVQGMIDDGIVMLAGNTDNLVRDNVVEASGRNGIWASGATGNTFEANLMLGNGATPGRGGVDARDDSGFVGPLQNTWLANQCTTDLPAGTICGVG